MKKLLYVITLVFIAALSAASQTAKPVPTPTPDNEVVKISTNLIQIDFTATDSRGKTVTDLRSDEIEIYQNGKKQDITNFSFISAGKQRVSTQTASQSRDEKLFPPSTPPVSPERVRRSIAIVFDDLSLNFSSVNYARKAIKRFVDEQMQDGDLVAIFHTSGDFAILPQFTDDKRLLYAAIDRLKWNSLGSADIGFFPSVGSGPAYDSSSKGFLNTRNAEAMGKAMRFIVDGLGQLPGRKSVLLFSDGYQGEEKEDIYNGVSDEILRSNGVNPRLIGIVEAANRGSVTIYTVDSRGLVYTGRTAADGTLGGGSLASIMTDAGNVMSQRWNSLMSSQESLASLSEPTGGFVIKNTNDISGGIQRIYEDQSYYLVGYQPDSETFTPEARKYYTFKVKVRRPGVNVRYRNGFVNIPEKPGGKIETLLASNALLGAVLMSPFASDNIKVHMSALFGADNKYKPVARVAVKIDARDLKFTDDTDGKKRAIVDMLAVTFGDNGQAKDQLATRYTIVVQAANYQKILDAGYVDEFFMPVAKPGSYLYRVAIRDVGSGKVGSVGQFIYLPDLQKGRLGVSGAILEDQEGSSDPVAKDAVFDGISHRVQIGKALKYLLEIYNAQLDKDGKPKLTATLRLFRDGVQVFEAPEKPLDLSKQTDMRRLKLGGSIGIDKAMPPGGYVLQIVITDKLAKEKEQIARQYAQFEVIE